MQIIKQSSLYKTFKRIKAMKKFQQWTEHDQLMLEFYSQFVSSNTLCFDIGANIGNRVKIFHKLQANVIAVEPQDECVKILESISKKEQNVIVVNKAIGASEGEAEIMISNVNTISSLSPEWIESVKKSGRFSDFKWNKKQKVKVTTLDKLITQYGIPSFIKIDVEGFEYQVLKGLSQPVKTLSFEFTPEFIESTFRSIDHISRLGDIVLNYSTGETMKLALKKWVTTEEMKEILSNFKEDNRLFGDIYVQFLI